MAEKASFAMEHNFYGEWAHPSDVAYKVTG